MTITDGREAALPSDTTQAGFADGTSERRGASLARPVPGLLLAWRPDDVAAADRTRIEDVVRVGRDPSLAWTILDGRLSREHFELRRIGERVEVHDLDSTNGTCVNGLPLAGRRFLEDQDVVRAGRCVFVFEADLRPVTDATGIDAAADGLAGSFHSPALVAAAAEAVRTGRHLLVEGESGVGKERVAHAVRRLSNPGAPFVAYNCARFSSPEEAETTLFGVVRGVFTGVEPRAGLVEKAEGGFLYLDELHELAPRLQRSLLRLADGGEFNRVGELTVRRVALRLLLGTNQPVEAAVQAGTLAHDLVARTHRLSVPPLARRRADIPAIFLAVLGQATRAAGLPADSLARWFTADHAEALALRDYGGVNVRWLEDLAASVVARLAHVPPAQQERRLAGLLEERMGGSPVFSRASAPPPARPARPADPEPARPRAGRPSRYELHREAILEAYRACGGNLTAIERTLGARGITVHRRWLVGFLERWGVRDRRGRAPR
ncbi:MAG: sigma 54-interacting transcriptional regulator [Myxococcales bacterium]|nr:sigma 54-interacting transcriptional regulator [Myxococcales bacterium]